MTAYIDKERLEGLIDDIIVARAFTDKDSDLYDSLYRDIMLLKELQRLEKGTLLELI